MKRIVNIAKSHAEAEEWDIKQQISLTPEERQRIAYELKIKAYGRNTKDVRETRVCKKIYISQKT
ncbi:MAG: hypothetical protein WHS65_08110 [Melioribacteraceae bacterium]